MRCTAKSSCGHVTSRLAGARDKGCGDGCATQEIALAGGAVNALTVGAVHSDASTGQGVSRAIQPYCDDNLPSLINAQGMGYRRGIKPEILVPGGRVVILEGLQRDSNATFDVYTQSRQPGQCVAAPGPTPGDLSYTWYARGTSNAAALASRTLLAYTMFWKNCVRDLAGTS